MESLRTKPRSGGEAGGEARRLRRKPGGRPHVVFLRLSDEERAVVGARAALAGVSVQRFLVEAALSPERTGAERRALYTTLLATQRAVAGAANNLNQVAKGVNSTGHLPLEWEQTAAAVRRGLGVLEAALDELRAP